MGESSVKTGDPHTVKGHVHREGVVDWRTIDPDTFKGSLLAEELLTYAEHLDELLARAEGSYVLIVGREVVSVFERLDQAALAAHQQFPGRPVLIKRVEAFEPIQTLGGAVLAEG
jgi:hypothetical protein